MRLYCFCATILFLPAILLSSDDEPIPSDKNHVRNWFDRNVGPFPSRLNSLDQALVSAEKSLRKIEVRPDGTAGFKTITDAIASIPSHNTRRVIVKVSSGVYTEKVQIDKLKPFVTLYGNPFNRPTLVYNGTKKKYNSTSMSATLIVDSDYFICAHFNIRNSAPIPDGGDDEQAVALRISGEKATLYNCSLFGFQDTLYDERGHHFVMNSYIEGTVDFIFGKGKSLYLNNEIRVLSGEKVSFITAQGRISSREVNGFSFVHCNVIGDGKASGFGYLGRVWKPYATVVFAYSELSEAINPLGWSETPEHDVNTFFGEYNNVGPGAVFSKRDTMLVKNLTDKQASDFIILGYINAFTWLLPPPNY